MKRFRLRRLLFVLATLLFIAALVARPVVWELRQENNNRALIAAVKWQDADAVVRLLNEGADANAKELLKDMRPLWRVGWDILRGRRRQSERLARTALLIGVSAFDMSPPASVARPSDHWAISISESEAEVRIMRALLEHRADPNISDSEGRSPLSYTLLFRQTRPALLLIQHGARLFITSAGNRLPLLIEAVQIDAAPSVLKAMLDRGADINAPGPEDGMTALISAASTADVSKVRLLLAYHANVAIKDSHGKTALDEASVGADFSDDKAAVSDYRQVIHMLHQAGARQGAMQ